MRLPYAIRSGQHQTMCSKTLVGLNIAIAYWTTQFYNPLQYLSFLSFLLNHACLFSKLSKPMQCLRKLNSSSSSTEGWHRTNSLNIEQQASSCARDISRDRITCTYIWDSEASMPWSSLGPEAQLLYSCSFHCNPNREVVLSFETAIITIAFSSQYTSPLQIQPCTCFFVSMSQQGTVFRT